MADNPGYVRQAAAIPVRHGKVCLITSSNGKRWVIPKGVIEPGQTAGETALQEAWEEAGLLGTLQQEPVGSYLYEKAGRAHHVTVFLMAVTEVAANWPERSYRQRSWINPAGAVGQIEEPGLADVLRLAFAGTDDLLHVV